MAQTPPRSLVSLMGFEATGDLGPLTIYTARRGQMVVYPKTPPLNPPSLMQRRMRNQFRLAATAWRQQTPSERATWLRVARSARLRITGFNLWVWYQRTRDRATLATIERLTQEQLPNV